jgi:predicted nucleic acid binding AN1-type Zn finger protein
MPSSIDLDRKTDPADHATDWSKCFSTTHKCDYWFRSTDGTTSWEDPSLRTSERKRKSVDDVPQSDTSLANAEEPSSIKMARRESHTSIEEKSSSSALKTRPEIAIIVPYRDLHKEQCRKQQLDRFVPFISKFMELHKSASSYRIYIIEQSDDNRKFNRGKLLNIGFQLACADGCKALIFHDVDLLPSPGFKFFLCIIRRI